MIDLKWGENNTMLYLLNKKGPVVDLTFQILIGSHRKAVFLSFQIWRQNPWNSWNVTKPLSLTHCTFWLHSMFWLHLTFCCGVTQPSLASVSSRTLWTIFLNMRSFSINAKYNLNVNSIQLSNSSLTDSVHTWHCLVSIRFRENIVE
jgi:hypothetical protein